MTTGLAPATATPPRGRRIASESARSAADGTYPATFSDPNTKKSSSPRYAPLRAATGARVGSRVFVKGCRYTSSVCAPRKARAQRVDGMSQAVGSAGAGTALARRGFAVVYKADRTAPLPRLTTVVLSTASTHGG